MDNLLKFINEHIDEDTSRLLLSRSKWPDIDIDTAVFTIDARRRLRSKLPRWAACDSLIVPTRLASEQCSSASTAAYKATLASRIIQSETLADLVIPNEAPSCTVIPSEAPSVESRNLRKGTIADFTSGLGADVLAFSQVAERVIYNDMNPKLVEAARHNLAALGADNVEFRCCEISPFNTVIPSEAPAGTVIPSKAQSAESRNLNSKTITEMLEGIVPDLIFADPARRDSAGGKVFLIEDCQPDIIGLREEIFSICRHLLIKLSPMADIAMVCDRLGPQCREVHIIGSEGECKELLVWMDREHQGDYSITATELGKSTDQNIIAQLNKSSVVFTPDQERSAVPLFASAEDIKEESILFEPGKALLKSGAFNLLCERFGLLKADVSSHLYLIGATPHIYNRYTDISSMGKSFKILEVAEFNNKSIKEIARKYPKAELTARNLPIATDQLRKKMGLKSGNLHIFAMKTRSLGNVILVTERIS